MPHDLFYSVIAACPQSFSCCHSGLSRILFKKDSEQVGMTSLTSRNDKLCGFIYELLSKKRNPFIIVSMLVQVPPVFSLHEFPSQYLAQLLTDTCILLQQVQSSRFFHSIFRGVRELLDCWEPHLQNFQDEGWLVCSVESGN